MNTVQLVFNPAAGRHSAPRIDALRLGFEGAGARVILSECGPGIPVAISDEASHICAVGGDGTARHVALALAGSGRVLPLSVYPAGTVNLLYREMNLPRDPALYTSGVLARTGPASHYGVNLNDTLFLACASVGPDAETVARLSPWLKRRVGRLAYAVSFLHVLILWPRRRITLVSNGRRIECAAFYVAKGRYFAGPWSFAPEARLTNPLLHVIALQRPGRLAYARFCWAMVRGRPVECVPGVAAFTCTALTAEASAPLPVQADGDIIAHLPARIALRPEPFAFH
ncbi:diacylglycerol/lipid kinase family protein [Sphingobium boeckii]|uniref:Diacylglycerol kinase family enzyme n=1 Tax=Sphingobium boeckii TaxID=1082345 RepID=A0A7W9EG91_9SPHN|nr:diacylglycerol kinase family protein [Sphingobium boeckii]MBB5686855.1 diacylglycerol kinase family enzyme [Sphingobium boeckii]